MTAPDVAALIAEVRDAENGCGDHGCLIRRPPGMGTNGGCRCFGERSLLRKVPVLFDLARRLADALEAAQACVNEWRWVAANVSLPGTGSPTLDNPRQWAAIQAGLANDLIESRAAAQRDTARLDWLERWITEGGFDLDMSDLCYGHMEIRAALDDAIAQEGAR